MGTEVGMLGADVGTEEGILGADEGTDEGSPVGSLEGLSARTYPIFVLRLTHKIARKLAQIIREHRKFGILPIFIFQTIFSTQNGDINR